MISQSFKWILTIVAFYAVPLYGDVKVTNGNNSGAGSLRDALSNIPINDPVVTIESNVASVNLTSDIIIFLFHNLKIISERSGGCDINGAHLRFHMRAYDCELENIDLNETIYIHNVTELIASQCSFTGTSNDVGGLAVANLVQQQGPQANGVRVFLTSCDASNSEEDGVQVICQTGTLFFDGLFCEFDNNKDDGLELQQSGSGDIIGEILLCDSDGVGTPLVQPGVNYNINETGLGSISIDISGCTASNATDTNIEYKEFDSGDIDTQLSAVTANTSNGKEGIEFREDGTGRNAVNLYSVTALNSTTDGVQLKSNNPGLTNSEDHFLLADNVGAQSAGGHGLQFDVTQGTLSMEGRNYCDFSNNGLNGFLAEKTKKGDIEYVDLINCSAASNALEGVKMTSTSDTATISAFLDDCYVIGNATNTTNKGIWIEMDHNHTSSYISVCVIDGVEIFYQPITLIKTPVEDLPHNPGTYLNWVLSDMAKSLAGL